MLLNPHKKWYNYWGHVRFMEQDEFTFNSPNNKYFVRSLYFDTFSYNAYIDKIHGETNRIKFRLRSYWKNSLNAKFLNLEFKIKLGSKISKKITRIGVAEYEKFISEKTWGRTNDPVLLEFERIMRLKYLSPKLLVDYNREGYIPKDKSELRITFDHSIRYSAAKILFPKEVNFRSLNPYLIVMEIKCKKDIPRWLDKIIKIYSLHPVPNSKYVTGIEHTQKEIYFAGY